MASIADVFTSAPRERYTKDTMTHAKWKVVTDEVFERVRSDKNKRVWAEQICDYVANQTRKFGYYNSRQFGVGIQWSIPVEFLDPFEAELDEIAKGDSPAARALNEARAKAMSK